MNIILKIYLGKVVFFQALIEKSYDLIPPEKWSNQLLNALTEEWKNERLYEKNDGWKILNEGEGRGRVIVANIETFVTLFGSDFIPDLKNCILVLEDEDATITLEERSLNALKLYKIFDNLKGLIFSKPEIYNNKNSGLKYEELIDEIVGKRDYPIIYNFDCGHTIPSICIPQNGIMNLVAKNGEIKIKIEK